MNPARLAGAFSCEGLLDAALLSCLALVAYTYLAYPLGVGLLSAAAGRPVRPRAGPVGPVSVVIAAHNEEALIAGRVSELAGHVAGIATGGEVIVVSDGSTDRTAGRAREADAGGVPVIVIERPANEGKSAALSAGCSEARHAVVAFGDVRQKWEPGALSFLLETLSDPAVGAVGGDLVIESAAGTLRGMGIYWSFEKWLRRRESLLHSSVGLTGAIAAVRRDLFRPPPPGTILDDVYWPLGVAMQGMRVIHDSRAVARDRLPGRARDEFRRKVRTLSGNFQLAARLPGALDPRRNPIWLQFASHKLLRLAVPWALIGAFVGSAIARGPWHRGAFWLQVLAYLIALAGLSGPIARRSRLASAAGSFLVLNAAAWVAFWVWASGRTSRTWVKATYAAPAAPPGGTEAAG